jgi:hypothetical protein
MNLHVYNAALLLGWLLVLVGGVLLHPAAGLVAAGLLLLVLVFLTVRLGGVYASDKDRA